MKNLVSLKSDCFSLTFSVLKTNIFWFVSCYQNVHLLVSRDKEELAANLKNYTILALHLRKSKNAGDTLLCSFENRVSHYKKRLADSDVYW